MSSGVKIMQGRRKRRREKAHMEDGEHTLDPTEASKLERMEVER